MKKTLFGFSLLAILLEVIFVINTIRPLSTGEQYPKSEERFSTTKKQKPAASVLITLTPSAPADSDNTEFGKTKQVGRVTYETRLNYDPVMATPGEVLDAVNSFRRSNGMSPLQWHDGLASWATSRASYFAHNGLDEHAGFRAEASQRANSYGMKGVGENAGEGGPLTATHWIEWVFAQDEPHKQILLKQANYLGVGIVNNNGKYGIDLIFGDSR